jgi:hypothetical protein
MAIVTGLTAEKMQEISDASVVTGAVNGTTGHLHLTTSGGTDIDAGNVVGPTGATGATGADGTTLSIDQIASAHVTAADWSNNSHKITSVGTGSSSGDAANVGQVCLSDGRKFTKAVTTAVSALTFGSSIPVDASLANDFRLTLTASTGTLANPTNLEDGDRFIVWVKQDATGSRTLAYGTNYKFTTALPQPTLSTAANAVDLLMFVYNSTIAKVIFVSFLAGVG